MVGKGYFNEKKNKQFKKNGSKNIWHTKNASCKSYLLGSWKEDICIPDNVQCDMYDGGFFVLFDNFQLCFILLTIFFLYANYFIAQ